MAHFKDLLRKNKRSTAEGTSDNTRCTRGSQAASTSTSSRTHVDDIPLYPSRPPYSSSSHSSQSSYTSSTSSSSSSSISSSRSNSLNEVTRIPTTAALRMTTGPSDLRSVLQPRPTGNRGRVKSAPGTGEQWENRRGVGSSTNAGSPFLVEVEWSTSEFGTLYAEPTHYPSVSPLGLIPSSLSPRVGADISDGPSRNRRQRSRSCIRLHRTPVAMPSPTLASIPGSPDLDQSGEDDRRGLMPDQVWIED